MPNLMCREKKSLHENINLFGKNNFYVFKIDKTLHLHEYILYNDSYILLNIALNQSLMFEWMVNHAN